jgi:hypothetical protein
MLPPLSIAERSSRSRQKAVDRGLAAVAAAAAAGFPAGGRLSALTALRQLRASVLREAAAEEAWCASLHARLRRSPAPAPLDLELAIAARLVRGGGHAAAASTVLDSLPDARALQFVERRELEAIAAAAAALRCGEPAGALAWAEGSGSRLRSVNSPLLFRLKLSKLIEMLGDSRRKAEALAYAEAHVAPLALTSSGGADAGRLALLSSAMSCLAFADPKRCGVPPLEALFSAAARDELAALFADEARAALGSPRVQPLEAAVALGLASLKARSCLSPVTDGGGAASAACPACPLCTGAPHFAAALAIAPECRRSVTSLMCAFSGMALGCDDAYVLPGGEVVAAATLAALTSGDGRFVLCPRTSLVHDSGKVRRAFVS